ncbi:unnamed protein product [Rotaria sordida]|uniref:Uncharacterized protein n=1 Tax=Rotaria sordida TaxID=392033 RepID=A0A816EUE9_9BILA|nr:unnamed protein product [Rotaria sordida]
MDDIPIEQLIAFSGETFYQHVQEHYGKNVEKILRFHDIDNYLILSGTSTQELLEIFEKPNDENATRELIYLKTEICNISEGKILLRIGTKNKMILLLKSAQDIVKKRKRQFTDQTKFNRLNKHRSTSSSLNTSSSDSETNMKKYATSIQESIGKILTNMKNHIHRRTYVNISANDFGIMIEDIDDQSVPRCSVQCICGDRIKLFFNHNRFQLSSLIKHLRNDNNGFKFLMKNTSQGIDDQKGIDEMDQMDVDEESSRNENNLLTTQNILNKHFNNSIGDIDNTAAVTTKKSYSQNEKSLYEFDGNTYNNTSSTTTINRDGNQRISNILATGGGTQSSISYISSSKSKQQLVNKEQPKTGRLPSNNQYSTVVKDQVRYMKNIFDFVFHCALQNINSNHSSQSKKRKINENDKQIRFYSLTKHNKKKSEQEIVYDKLQKSDILSTLLNTIDSNRHRPPNNYRYPTSVLRFETCFFILAGVYVYEYVRINLKFLLPSVYTVKKFYTQNPYSEARFRFDECVNYLSSYQCQYVFMSEDCSAIIPRVEYDSTFNIFNGLVIPVLNGVPTENSSQFNSFDDLKHAIETTPRSNLVNVHLVQPISTSDSYVPSATVLSAIDKLNALTELKQFELTNEYDKIIFPVHHKVKRLIDDTGSKINEKNIYFHVDYVEEIIFKAYEVAQQMAENVGMNVDLTRNNLFDIQQSSQIAKQLLKLNSLTEEETLVIDDKDSDEEDDDDECGGDEEDDGHDERGGVEEEDDDHDAQDAEQGEEDDDEYEYDIEEENDVEANDEGDGIEESNNSNDDHIVSEDDSKPTSSFENVQAISYSGVYQRMGFYLDC